MSTETKFKAIQCKQAELNACEDEFRKLTEELNYAKQHIFSSNLNKRWYDALIDNENQKELNHRAYQRMKRIYEEALIQKRFIQHMLTDLAKKKTELEAELRQLSQNFSEEAIRNSPQIRRTA